VGAVVRTVNSAGDVVQADLTHMVEVLGDDFREMAGGRLLITGGAGFLGYYLVQAPLAWNARRLGNPVRVVVYDNYWRGVPDWLAGLHGRPDLEVVEHDMRSPLPRAEPFDFVVHAAGIASPSYYRKHPIETMDANITGLRNLLDLAEQQAASGHAMRGFLFYSSSEIYGDPTPEAIPTPETYRGNVSCTGPRACYDESKRYGETLCVNFARARGVPTRMARPFNNYGPGMKITDGRVIADFCRAVVEGRDIVMFSDGSPTRTFCYVADAVAGYYRVLTRGGDGEPYNIGAAAPEISMAELAHRIRDIGEALFGYAGSVVLGASPEQDYLVDNPNRRCPDIAKARREVGYEPVFSLDEGLRRTLLWYAEHPQGDDR
jgi:dTDP-glucose 4,6-dehydratase/UDP-glucuronate decarboxylase